METSEPVRLVQHIVVDRGDAPRATLVELVAQASVLALVRHRTTHRERVDAWLSGPFAKIVRVARKGDPTAEPGSGALTVSTPDVTISVHPPMSREEMPRTLNRSRMDGFSGVGPETAPLPDRGTGPLVLLDASLGLSTGKACAQAAHATMMMHLVHDVFCDRVLEVSGTDFATLRGSEPDVVVCDAGRTETEPGTITAIGFTHW